MIYVIGIGPGDLDYILPAARKAANRCQVLVGGRRALSIFTEGNWEKFQVTGDLARLKNFLAAKLDAGLIVGILVSGDPGFYSLLPFIRKSFPDYRCQVIPGVSSLQMAFCKAGIPWQDALLASAHGRPLENLDIRPQQTLGLLTGKGVNSPQGIAEFLLSKGPNRRVCLGNNLSYADEQWLETDLVKLAQDETDYPNAVMIVLPVEGE